MRGDSERETEYWNGERAEGPSTIASPRQTAAGQHSAPTGLVDLADLAQLRIGAGHEDLDERLLVRAKALETEGGGGEVNVNYEGDGAALQCLAALVTAASARRD